MFLVMMVVLNQIFECQKVNIVKKFFKKCINAVQIDNQTVDASLVIQDLFNNTSLRLSIL